MIDPIPYDSIEQKNELERQMSVPLTSSESLVLCLDMMDFYAAFRHRREPEDDGINWIVLEMKTENDKQ